MEGLDGGEPSWVGFLGVLWAQAHLIHAPWNTGAPAVPSKFTFQPGVPNTPVDGNLLEPSIPERIFLTFLLSLQFLNKKCEQWVSRVTQEVETNSLA